MQELVKVAVDAMGGDHAPLEIVKGAVEAVNSRDDIKVFLVGQEEAVRAELQKYQYDASRIEVVNATEVIEMAEPPVQAIRTKKDSSIVVAMKMVKNGEADAFVGAGSSGAILVGGQLIVGRIKGVERPPLAPLLPTEKGASLLIDCGANVDARPAHLVQFAKMGAIYMEHVVGITNPRVAIVNIGAEEEKGNALVKETFPLLKACKDINFIGSIEARDIPSGYADVIVCVGNAIKGADALPRYRRLAARLGGKLACTRPVFDRGVLPFKLVIGQSGAVVKPKLLLSFGVSGAVNHVTGFSDADVVVAVNTDPEAAIFNYCTYGIVGDMDEVCEAMLAKLGE